MGEAELILLKGIIVCDSVNYKDFCLTLMFPFCDFKCDKINDCKVCQNSSLIQEDNIEISNEKIYDYYVSNPLTKAICCQGLEPLDSFDELINFIHFFRIRENAPIIIYTGYNKEEVPNKIKDLKKYSNIIVKWGRFIMNQSPHFDKILGVNLASDNQYGEKL